MSDDKVSGHYFFTQPTIMTFPALFTPRKARDRAGKETGDPRYEANFVFDPAGADWQAIKQVAAKVAKARNPDVDLSTLGWPFKNGTVEADKRKAKGKSDGEFARGKGILVAKTGEKYPPGLTVIENGQPVDLTDEALKAKFKSKFYSGVLVYAQVNLCWYDAVGNGKPGVTCRLNSVISTGKGDRIGGGMSGSELFAKYIGTVTTEDPTAGMASDEIPF